MNCKLGDLAVVARVRAPQEEQFLGRIVTCVQLDKLIDGYQCWKVEPTLFPYERVSDWCLRPIRDPGEDAQDETLSWLPVPLPELV